MSVTLVHPKLPGREITVSDGAQPHHERAGWRSKDAAKTLPKRRREVAEEQDQPAESGE